MVSSIQIHLSCSRSYRSKHYKGFRAVDLRGEREREGGRRESEIEMSMRERDRER